ncbi:MAG TPA: hypothetical protein VII06_05455 [Chloroflexota bacterium]|jgi:hypothetical protein
MPSWFARVGLVALIGGGWIWLQWRAWNRGEPRLRGKFPTESQSGRPGEVAAMRETADKWKIS